ncbi:MAG: SusC/RagA family TonB-linked outer membrane protein [Bacteroidetes bacterium]|nr:MAG: SusC/RagA family TonB-linked outer membrane protein [Bacteroidota bacterium]
MSIKHRANAILRLLLTLLVVGVSGSISAQMVTGTVTSSRDGEPLVGATVMVKGTTTGAFTDDQGSYSVRAAEDAVLMFSFVGHERQEIAVEGRSTINVELVATEATLEEVVVTGYGTQRAREVSSAITSVKAENFNAGQVNDPTQLIQGKVAGLNISKPGGDPNGGFSLRLRGISTFGANAQPLIVIDGVIGGELNSVDPADIADISVLKDGSAAAIYGSRASAGVIIITTKRGIAGSTNINYNGFVSAEQVARTVPTADRATFLELKGNDQDQGADTDWVDEVTRTGISQVHNLSMSGGFGSTSYRAALNLRDIRGVGLVSGFTQLNGRLNLTQKALNDKLSISVDVANTVREAQYGFAEAYRYANLYNPTAPVTSDDEAYVNFGGYWQSPNFDYFNPRAILDQNTNEGELKTLLTSIRGSYEIVDGLTASAFVSRQRRSNLYGEFYSRESYFRGGANEAGEGVLGRARRYTEDETNDLLEATLNYVTDFGSTHLDVLGGYSWNELEYQGFGLEGTGLPSDAFGYNNLGALQAITDQAVPLNVFSSKNNYRVIGFFGRARVNIDNTYNLMASLRYEGSSRFGAGNKWGIFPAVSGSVMLTNLFDLGGFDELKFRAGYGITGALPPSSYISLQRFAPANFFLYEGAFIPAIGAQNNPNPDLRWERKGEINVGLDWQMFDYKFSGSIDYFNRVIRDLIYPGAEVNSPPFTFPTMTVNLNHVVLRSSGLEGTFGYNLESGNFSWNPNLALTYYFPVILDSLPGVTPDFRFGSEGSFLDFSTSPGAPGLNNNPTQRITIGEPLGQFYGYPIDIAASEAANSWVYDETRRPESGEDQTIIANGKTGLPTFSLGLNNSFAFGDVDFSFFLRGDFGHYMLNMYRVFYESVGGDRVIENSVVTDRYQNINDVQQVNDYYVENASYLVLDNAQLGYTMDLKEGRSLRVYLAGQNLFWLTNYTGVDPSVRWADPGSSDNGGRANTGGGNPLFPGLDRRNIYFTTRTFTLGVNLNL